MIERNDTFLVSECLGGNSKAYDELVSRHQKSIFNLAIRMTGSADDAADITQTVFIKAYKKLNTFDHKHKFYSWIYRIALNETLNYLKRSRKIEKLNKNMLSNEILPDEAYIVNELNIRVKEALMGLAIEYRILIILKHFHNFSYSEIASILKISNKKVKSRLYTARQLLKDILIRDDVLDNG